MRIQTTTRPLSALVVIALGLLLGLGGCPTDPSGNANTNGGTNDNGSGGGNSNSNSNTNNNTNSNGNDNGTVTAPVIADIPNETIEAGVDYTGPTPELAAGNGSITWTLDEGPDGMTIDAATGVVTWPAPPTDDAPQLISIKAGNSAGSDTEVWLLTIEAAELVAVRRVSVSRTGTQGNQESNGASISADGSRLAFASRAGNLVTGDNNDTFDVFVVETSSQIVRRCSVRTGGAATSQASFLPALSASGNVVVFRSSDAGLVSGDTNNRIDIFAFDLSTGVTELISRRSASLIGNDASDLPAVSADGRFVAFESLATNLVSGDDNGVADIFVRDRNTGATIRVSLSSNGQETDGASGAPRIAGENGRYIVFESDATNLASGDTGGRRHVYRHDRVTGETLLVSVNRAGNPCNNSCISPRVTPDGRYVVFQSRASDLIEGDSNGFLDVFRRDMVEGATIRVSSKSATFQGNNASLGASISDDGRFIAFESKATNLVDNDLNEFTDVFLRDTAVEID